MTSSASGALAPIPVVTSVAPVTAGRDVWLGDIWGVMHNGVKPFEAACEACEAFRGTGGTVLLLSNAPRPASSVAEQLDRIGVPRSAYDAIVTSGDAARAMIGELGAKPVFHLGPERDRPIFAGLEVAIAEASRAEALVCTGLFDDETETPASYMTALEDFARRGLPMICANPDLTVERGGKIVYCAGALAVAYEALGGPVKFAGKPYLPVYDLALQTIAQLRSAAVSKPAILAIGDGINTDIKGAAAAGIASVYIASAVHLAPGETLDAAALDHLFPSPAIRPIAAMNGLAW